MKDLLKKAVEVIGQDTELSNYATEAYVITVYEDKIVIQGDFLPDKSFQFKFQWRKRRFYKKHIRKDNILFEIIASVQ